MEHMRDGLKTAAERILKIRQNSRTTAQSGTSPKDGTPSRDSYKQAESLDRAGIYRRFHGVTFAAIEERGLPQDMRIRTNYSLVKEYAKDLEENVKAGKGLVLSGFYGTMKTTMAVAVLRQWLDSGHGGLMVPMCSLIDNLFTMQGLNREECARYEKRIRGISLLVLDDLGGENTDQHWVLSKVDSIITERYNKMLPIIATTNLTPKELSGTYSGRVMDRLRCTSRLLQFGGVSQREAAK